jgi:O-antigen ligase
MNNITQKANSAASPLLIIFAFVFPLSTSGGSILAILLVLTWFASGNLKGKLDEISRNPLAIAVLFYLFLHAIGLFWTQDLDWGLHILRKQWKLLLFPVFLTLVRKDHTKYYLSAFVAAIFVESCKYYLIWLGILSLQPGSILTTIGSTHITYSPMLALAIYIVGQNILFEKNRPITICLKTSLFLFLSCAMFISRGRAGQVAFFLLLAVLLFQYFYPRSKKMLVVTILLLPLLAVSIFQYCPTFRSRVNLTVTGIHNFELIENTSMGQRLWFAKNTFLLLKENWLVGTGTGDFPLEYAKINQIHSPGLPNTDNPHNQYLLSTVQFGIVGFISLTAIFLTQLTRAFRKKDPLTLLRQAFPIFFLVIMLAESYLQVYETGFLFSLFSSFLYKDLS